MTAGEPATLLANALRLRCPHCGLQAMSAGRKWRLTLAGWDQPVACQACGQQVQVQSFSVMAWTAPFIFLCLCAAVALAFRWMSVDWAVSLLVLSGLVALAGLLFGIPLGRKGRTDEQLVQRARAAANAPRA